eukprot:1836100-Pleurochrysis_carterae.AAC.1
MHCGLRAEPCVQEGLRAHKRMDARTRTHTLAIVSWTSDRDYCGRYSPSTAAMVARASTPAK